MGIRLRRTALSVYFLLALVLAALERAVVLGLLTVRLGFRDAVVRVVPDTVDRAFRAALVRGWAAAWDRVLRVELAPVVRPLVDLVPAALFHFFRADFLPDHVLRAAPAHACVAVLALVLDFDRAALVLRELDLHAWLGTLRRALELRLLVLRIGMFLSPYGQERDASDTYRLSTGRIQLSALSDRVLRLKRPIRNKR